MQSWGFDASSPVSPEVSAVQATTAVHSGALHKQLETQNAC